MSPRHLQDSTTNFLLGEVLHELTPNTYTLAGRIDWLAAAWEMVAQFLGALCGGILLKISIPHTYAHTHTALYTAYASLFFFFWKIVLRIIPKNI